MLAVSAVFEEYYRLAFLRKPEYMGWSQTEPTTQVKLSDFSKEEIWRRIKAYDSLIEKVDSLSAFIPQERKDAWFQLAVYPIKGSAYMNHKFLYWNLAAMTSDEKEKTKYELLASEAFHKIEVLTDFYNTKLSNGKWNKMMSMRPRNLPVFDSVKKPESVKIEQEETENRIAIQANQFVSKKGFKNYEWKTINGLGYSNNAITLFPLKQQYFKTEKPFVIYEFEIKTSGEYEVEVRLLPTHANNFDHQIGVQLDKNTLQNFKTNTRDRDKTWKENVLRNGAIVKLPALNLEKGKHTIKVEVNQTGIVLDQLAIYPSSEGSSYEIPLK
ncbi:hypothetical protein ACQ9BO_19050 [Flavobacterium sp. P21]|uniref:hypothetical protein n=1 Tax=Flavobacterium sp. P21 TaxID=3423948 RepID=UPI003D679D3E